MFVKINGRWINRSQISWVGIRSTTSTTWYADVRTSDGTTTSTANSVGNQGAAQAIADAIALGTYQE